MQIKRFEQRYTGPPYCNGEYSIKYATENPYTAKRWLKEFTRMEALENHAVAITEDGAEYKCELEHGVGMLGVQTPDGFRHLA